MRKKLKFWTFFYKDFGSDDKNICNILWEVLRVMGRTPVKADLLKYLSKRIHKF